MKEKKKKREKKMSYSDKKKIESWREESSHETKWESSYGR